MDAAGGLMDTTTRGVMPGPFLRSLSPRTAADNALFAELKDVLERHHAVSRFGIALLHDHFDMAPDELLAETCDAATRTLVCRPARRADLRGVPLDTMWRLDIEGSREVQCVATCYIDPQLKTHVSTEGDGPGGEPDEPENPNEPVKERTAER
jgi:hypothetical protein